jgi:small redox-active disulfide protein 2
LFKEPMVEIKVLGPGCANCERLYAETEKALTRLGMKVQLTKVQEIHEIAAHGVMMTPALVIDGKVKSSGRIPNQAELTDWLSAASANE